MQLKNHANLSVARLRELEGLVTGHTSLQDVMNWGLAQPAGTLHHQIIAAAVVQDEFSHDVIVPWRDQLFLVYSTT